MKHFKDEHEHMADHTELHKEIDRLENVVGGIQEHNSAMRLRHGHAMTHSHDPYYAHNKKNK